MFFRSLFVCVCLLTGLPAGPAPGQPPVHEGILKPAKLVTLNAPLSGVVATVPVVEGQAVTTDDLLVHIDDRLQQVALESAQAEAQSDAAIEVARLAMVDLNLQVESLEKAHAAHAASAWEVERIRTQAAQAAAELRRTQDAQHLARIRTEAEQVRLDQYRIQAPFPGRVLRLTAEAGASVTPQDPLLILVALDTLKAEFHLPAGLYGRLKAGQATSLTIQGAEPQTVPAKVLNVDPVIDSASLTFRVVFEIDNQEHQLPAGLVAFWTP